MRQTVVAIVARHLADDDLVAIEPAGLRGLGLAVRGVVHQLTQTGGIAPVDSLVGRGEAKTVVSQGIEERGRMRRARSCDFVNGGCRLSEVVGCEARERRVELGVLGNCWGGSGEEGWRW